MGAVIGRSNKFERLLKVVGGLESVYSWSFCGLSFNVIVAITTEIMGREERVKDIRWNPLPLLIAVIWDPLLVLKGKGWMPCEWYSQNYI